MPAAAKPKQKKPKNGEYWVRIRDDAIAYVTHVASTEITFHMVVSLHEYTRDLEQFLRNYRPKSV